MAINERKLSKDELKKREDIIMKMKGNKRDLVKKYGKDAEAVMYGRATNMAKKQTKATEEAVVEQEVVEVMEQPITKTPKVEVSKEPAKPKTSSRAISN